MSSLGEEDYRFLRFEALKQLHNFFPQWLYVGVIKTFVNMKKEVKMGLGILPKIVA